MSTSAASVNISFALLARAAHRSLEMGPTTGGLAGCTVGVVLKILDPLLHSSVELFAIMHNQ
eukprot:2383009-Prorocentrum_lima.AAC.1